MDKLKTKSEEATGCEASAVERLVILQRVPKESINMQPFRSGGFLNKDYDMGRITIDLPIIEARKLLTAMKAI